MNKLDIKVIIIAIFLVITSVISYIFWEKISIVIMKVLLSNWLTFSIWVSLFVTLLIHYQKNKTNNKNIVSDKEGLEKPFDYIQFYFTYGAIGYSLQILSKEVFAHFNYPQLSKCTNFTGFDNFSFIAVIVILTLISYNRILPIFQETYTKKSKITKHNNAYIS